MSFASKIHLILIAISLSQSSFAEEWLTNSFLGKNPYKMSPHLSSAGLGLQPQDIPLLPDTSFSSLEKHSKDFLVSSIRKGVWGVIRFNNQYDLDEIILSKMFSFNEFNAYHRNDQGQMVAAKRFQTTIGQPPMFRIPIKKGMNKIYVRVKAKNLMGYSFDIQKPENAKLTSYLFTFFKAIFFGIISGLFLYNLILLIKIRNSAFIFYLGYLLGVASHGWPLGLVPSIPYSEAVGFFSKLEIQYSSLLFTGQMSILFAMKLLKIRTFAPKVFYFGWCVFAIAAIGLINNQISHISNTFFTLLVAAWSLFQYLSMASGIKRQYRPAYYYSLAWMPLVTVIPYVYFDVFINGNGIDLMQSLTMAACAVFEIIMLSFALGELVASERRKAAQLGFSMQVAESVQKTLLPSEDKQSDNPKFQIRSFYRSAEEVGGDCFHFQYEAEHEILYIQIADVTGHGIGSAMLTGVITGGLLALEESNKDLLGRPEDYLLEQARSMNYTLSHTAGEAGKLASMIFLAIDLESGKGSYVNAGHPHICKFGNQQSQFLVTPNKILGVEEDFGELRIGKFQMQANESLLLYTDGLIENETYQGTMSLKQLEKFMAQATPKMAHDHFSEMMTNENNKPLEDDCSYLMVTWNGPSHGKQSA